MTEPVYGARAFVVEVGEPDAGPPLVLVHGLGDAASRDWHSVLGRLATRRRVVLFDLPGFGRSTKANVRYEPRGYVKFIHALVRAKELPQFQLMGHSMGASIALLYAATYPEDVERLVLVDAAGILHRHAHAGYMVHHGLGGIPGLNELGPASGAVASIVDPLLRMTFRHEPNPQAILETSTSRSGFLSADPNRIAALSLILEDFSVPIASTRLPTLVVWGRNDSVAPPRTAILLHARLPRSKMVWLERSAHVPMADEPDAFTAAVDTWLRSGDPAGPTAAARLPEAEHARCYQEEGRTYSGDYADIEIVGCRNVLLRDVHTAALRIRDSVVSIETSAVVGPGTALSIDHSRVQATASDFSGSSVGVELNAAQVDFAGVELTGGQAAIRAIEASRVVFSVSQRRSSAGRSTIHESRDFAKGEQL